MLRVRIRELLCRCVVAASSRIGGVLAQCAKLRQLFAETLDTTVILLSCLPEPIRNERFLNALMADSRIRLTNAALVFVIPDWRTLVASNALKADD